MRTNNNLLNGYQNFTNNNVPFRGNQLLNNNPSFMGSIRDQDFLQRMQMAKMEQMRKIRSIKDIGISNDKLVKYIVQTIPEVKLNSNASIQLYNNLETTYPKFKKNLKKEDIPSILTEWYSGRTNLPYKNILKKENYNKAFKTLEDLIVHKVTSFDKDRTKLIKDYEELKSAIETHNNELKVIFSLSEDIKAKHKQEFEYVNVYKYKIAYDPKNFDDLKKIYVTELKKIENESQHIDNLIETLMENEKISPEEVEKIKQEYDYKPAKKDIAENLEEKLKREIGDAKFNELLAEIEKEEMKKMDEEEKPKKKIKFKESIEEVKEEHRKITIKVTEKETKQDEDLIEKYRNRKKKT